MNLPGTCETCGARVVLHLHRWPSRTVATWLDRDRYRAHTCLDYWVDALASGAYL